MCFWLFLKNAEVQAALGRRVQLEGNGLGWVRAATLMSPDGPVGPGACGLGPSEPPRERGQERGPRVTRSKSRDSTAAVRGTWHPSPINWSISRVTHIVRNISFRRRAEVKHQSHGMGCQRAGTTSFAVDVWAWMRARGSQVAPPGDTRALCFSFLQDWFSSRLSETKDGWPGRLGLSEGLETQKDGDQESLS